MPPKNEWLNLQRQLFGEDSWDASNSASRFPTKEVSFVWRLIMGPLGWILNPTLSIEVEFALELLELVVGW